MAPNKVILLACGSFNPPTNMHLRMFEIARDQLHRLGQYLVVGGVVSPVHDAYGKKELAPATYRCEMLKLALKTSDWIRVSDWECSQEVWSRTRQVLQYHQNLLNSVLNDKNSNSPNKSQRCDMENGINSANWITNDVRNIQGPVQIKLLCGADLLESFGTPGLWSEDDIEAIIGQHGLIVITRQGCDPRHFIYESDVLTRYQHNIVIVNEWITNDVSSTKIRRALRRQESVKYLIEDTVIDFIKKHGLYGFANNDFKYTFINKPNINDNLNVPISNFVLTPSPSDVNMIPPNYNNDILLELNSINQNISEPDFVSGSRAVLIKSPETDAYENTETFQSRAEIKFGSEKTEESQNEKNQKGQKSQYPGQAVQVIMDKSCGSPKSKKVGFFDTGKIDYEFVNYDICEAPNNWGRSPKKVVASVKQTPEIQKVSYDQNKPQVKVKKLEKSPKKKVTDLSDFSDESNVSNVSKTEVLQENVQKPIKKPPKRCSKTPDLRKVSKMESEGNEKGSKSRNVLKRSNSDAIMSRRNENGEAVSVKIQFTKDGVKVISDKESIV